MKFRQVFCASDYATAQAAMLAARAAGADDEDISLIARADIEMQRLPSERLDTSTDMLPSALRGSCLGAGLGVAGALVALLIPAVEMNVAGAALVVLVGAMVGAWSAALVGSTVPNHVRRKFEREIDAGNILVVVDDQREHEAQVRDAVRRAGATPLPFHDASVLN
ncbi:hypothetical protein [Dokdonella sp.]|uniref:hypothetical protein n=1 Tax=Dokdonella sp. TaxID=2291710 RepID=UPI002F42FD05